MKTLSSASLLPASILRLRTLQTDFQCGMRRRDSILSKGTHHLGFCPRGRFNKTQPLSQQWSALQPRELKWIELSPIHLLASQNIASRTE